MSEATASWRHTTAGIVTLVLTLACVGRASAQPTPPARPAPAPAGGAAAPRPAPAAAANPAAPTGWAENRIIPKTEVADVRDWEKKRFNIRGMIRNQQQNSAEFRDFFELYFLPQLTQADSLARAPALRDELADTFANSERMRNPAAREVLNEIVLAYMLTVVNSPVRAFVAGGQSADVMWNGDERKATYWRLPGSVVREGNKNVYSRGEITFPIARRGPPKQKFHPACLYNAMLVIGGLNESVKIQQNVVVAETPWRKALKPMVDAAGNEKLPEAVRLAAMVGIRRHIEKGELTENARDVICAVLTRVCKERPAAAGPLADGHLWIRRQAISLIGACRTEGANQNFSRALAERMIDPNEPLSVRQEAAAALAFVQPAKQKPADAVALAGKLADLVEDLVNYELLPAPHKQPQFSRRRVGDGFDCVALALGGKSARLPTAVEGQPAAAAVGILPGTSGNEKAFVQGLIERVTALRKSCATMKEPMDEAALREKLSEGKDDIRQFVGAGPETAAAQKRDLPTAEVDAPATRPATGTQPVPMTPMTSDPFDPTP